MSSSRSRSRWHQKTLRQPILLHYAAPLPLIKSIEFCMSHDLLDLTVIMLKNGKAVCLVTCKHQHKRQ